ncbi:aminotransferase class V-fold PLP-dependent enzyme [Profundibacterium mesophilum]|nr:aminotransferase class V-fold PLP-dependent enzyme [Profundibacterium mesophilum]
MTPLDTDFVRSQFPAFADPSLAEQSFFENAGGSFACAQVIDRLTAFYVERKVQPHGAYAASKLGGEQMDEARRRLAGMLNVPQGSLSIGPSTSQNIYVLANAFAQMLRPGDAVIVTNQDHEANSGPWRRLAASGIEIREWRMDPDTGHLDPADLEALLADGRVRLLCFPHCSNIVGEINDVPRITAMARAAGAASCVDGVSYAPHGLPDIGALGADIYLFSAYKTFGPHQGIMVVREALAEVLPNQAHHFNAAPQWKRFVPAGPDHAQVAACAGLADYVDLLYHKHFPGGAENAARRAAQVHDLIRAHETALLGPLLDHVTARPGLRLLGPRDAARRAPTVSLALGRPAAEVARQLAPHGIMAAGGSFYAQRTLEGLGVDPDHGVLRLSFVHYTRKADLDRLLSALDRVV